MGDSTMKQAAEHHRAAIQHLQSVKALREQGAAATDVAQKAQEQFGLAYQRELEALKLLEGIVTEPLKSDIYSTAALAALGLEQWSEAERLAREGLVQEAPDRTVRELNAIIDAAQRQQDLF